MTYGFGEKVFVTAHPEKTGRVVGKAEESCRVRWCDGTLESVEKGALQRQDSPEDPLWQRDEIPLHEDRRHVPYFGCKESLGVMYWHENLIFACEKMPLTSRTLWAKRQNVEAPFTKRVYGYACAIYLPKEKIAAGGPVSVLYIARDRIPQDTPSQTAPEGYELCEASFCTPAYLGLLEKDLDENRGRIEDPKLMKKGKEAVYTYLLALACKTYEIPLEGPYVEIGKTQALFELKNSFFVKDRLENLIREGKSFYIEEISSVDGETCFIRE